MANLNILELRAGAIAGSQVGQLPAVAKQSIAIGSNQTQSAAMNAETKLVRLHAEANCTVKVGTAPEATATDELTLIADVPEYFEITPAHKISVITR